MLGGVSRSCCQEGKSQGDGALVAAAGRRVEGGRPGGKGTVGSGDRAALEDSGLILGAEAPLRVWLWVHDPGNTSVGRGLLVRIRRFQLPNKERGGGGQDSKWALCTRTAYLPLCEASEGLARLGTILSCSSGAIQPKEPYPTGFNTLSLSMVMVGR